MGTIDRSRRISQIERFVVLGLSLSEMAERLNVSTKTIQRDLNHRHAELAQSISRSTNVYRQSVLAELGRLYAEATKDTATARTENRDTHQYIHARHDILRTIIRVTGADAPIKVEISGAVEHSVRMLPESELLRIVERTALIDAQMGEAA